MRNDWRRSLRERYRRLLAPILLAAVGLGLLATPFLPEHAQPVKWHGGPELGRLVFEERASVATRFGVYERLREIAGGGTLFVPVDGSLDPHAARGLGAMTVDVADYSAAVDVAGLPVAASGTYDGAGEAVEYLILEGTGTTWWEGEDDGRIVLVPATLIPVPRIRNG